MNNFYHLLKVFFVFCLLYETSVFSKESDTKAAKKTNKDIPIHRILSDYQRRQSVTMEVEKTLTQPLLKREIESKGKFYFANKLWRFEVSHPHSSILFYDGSKVTYFANNVSHHAQNRQEAVLADLLDPEAFYKKFTYQGTHQKGRTQIYSFSGKTPSPQKLSIQAERDRILSLRIYWDAALGEEFYRFRSIQFDQKLDKKLFQEP